MIVTIEERVWQMAGPLGLGPPYGGEAQRVMASVRLEYLAAALRALEVEWKQEERRFWRGLREIGK